MLDPIHFPSTPLLNLPPYISPLFYFSFRCEHSHLQYFQHELLRVAPSPPPSSLSLWLHFLRSLRSLLNWRTRSDCRDERDKYRFRIPVIKCLWQVVSNNKQEAFQILSPGLPIALIATCKQHTRRPRGANYPICFSKKLFNKCNKRTFWPYLPEEKDKCLHFNRK